MRKANTSYPTRFVVFLCLSLFLCGAVRPGAEEKPPKPPRGFPNYTLIKMAAAVGLVKLMDLSPAVPENLVLNRDIEYRRIGGKSLTLDICRPDTLLRPTPALVFIHGGAWRSGDKSDYLVYLIDFAKRGYITVSVSYRLVQEAIYPAALEDVRHAIRWLQLNAGRYRIDPGRIAVIGGSAGGHLAMMAGYAPDSPRSEPSDISATCFYRLCAVVNLYGPADLTADIAIENSAVIEFLGKTYAEDPELYREASPITHITEDDPPTLIFHGTIDDVVPVDQSDLLKRRLDAAGVRAEYHRLKGWPHAMDIGRAVNRYCQYYMTAFFHKHLPLTE
jgi:acetyl esterase/lipase